MMKSINFGLKLWSTNIDLIGKAIKLIDEKTFDYIELFIVPDTQVSPFIIDVPYIIHIPHYKFGVNIGKFNKKEYNLQRINESKRWAKELDAKYLVLHPGYGSMDCAAEVLREVSDNRILIENMPTIALNGERMVGYSPEQMEKLMDNTDMGFCLDLNHATKAAVSVKKPYKEFIEEFLKLGPKIFHISDGKLNNEKDEHLNIGGGDYDFGFFLKTIKDNPYRLVTVETPRIDKKALHEDIQNIKKLKMLGF